MPKYFYLNLLFCSFFLQGCDKGDKHTIVQGLVVDGITHKPLGNFPVRLKIEGGGFDMGGIGYDLTRSDKYGFYRFDFWTERFTSYGIEAGAENGNMGILGFKVHEGVQTNQTVEAYPVTTVHVQMPNAFSKYGDNWQCSVRPLVSIAPPVSPVYYTYNAKTYITPYDLHHHENYVTIPPKSNCVFEFIWERHGQGKKDSVMHYKFHVPDAGSCEYTLVL